MKYQPRGEKVCFVHGLGHSLYACKFLRGYSEKYTAQRPNKEDRSVGREKRGKLVKFNKNTKYSNSMEISSIPKKRV